MDNVIHVVSAVIVNDVNVIRVTPTNRPRVNEPERIAAVVEAPMIVVASVDMEIMPAAKTGAVVVVRNTTMIAATRVSTVRL